MALHPRPVRALLGVAALALVLTACGSQPSSTSSPSPTVMTSPQTASASPSASPAPTITASPNLDGVKVTGEYGKAPKVTLPGPWAIAKTQAKVLVPGDGTVVATTSTVQVNYQGVNGRTGEVFDESFTKGQPIAFSLNQVIPGFREGLTGQKAGSRVLIGINSVDGYDGQGGQQGAGIEVGDTLVFVVDILQASLPGPTGATVAPKSGLPTVADENGKPVVTIASGLTKPTSLVVQPLVEGTGRKLAATDSVLVNYTMVAWSTGKVVKQTYGYAPLTGALSSTIEGWKQGLVGKTVGSRLLLVVPPSLAYPSGNTPLGIGKDETLVFVVDILFAQSAA